MKVNKIFGGVLLVAGTAIGAGMLALPTATGIAGLAPSLTLFIVCWMFMAYTAFLTLEVSLWVKKDADLITMAERTLGKTGKMICAFTYLLLLYSLSAAYISGSSQILTEVWNNFSTNYDIPPWLTPIPVLLLFGAFVYAGTASSDYLNRILMLGLVITYSTLAFFLPSHVATENFMHCDWNASLTAFSIVITSFGFHIIIPMLCSYLDYKPKALFLALMIGSALPLLVYLIWEILILGIIPLFGEHSITQAWINDSLVTQPLQALLSSPWIATAARFFSFFSIVTSFLGVSLSLTHFLSDGLKIKKTHSGRLLICLLAFVPPLAFVLTGTRHFYMALEYAGIFVALLLGIYPVLMAWSSRSQGGEAPLRVRGGRPALILSLIFFSGVIILELFNKLGFLRPLIQEYIG
jgi:tyrosine-specific transport protein